MSHRPPSTHVLAAAFRPAATLALALVLCGAAAGPLRACDREEGAAACRASSSAWLLKTAGVKGTRGSLDVAADLDAARELDRCARAAVYFRLGRERWISYDPETIAQVRAACADEDRSMAATGPDDEGGHEAVAKAREARREAIERRTASRIERIARTALRRGAADAYGSGGSSVDAPRSPGARFFLPPGSEIW